MIPKADSRRIGGVNIFEIQGIFGEPWVTRIKEGIKQVLREYPGEGLLFNVREVKKIDRPGAEAILELTEKPAKGGILGQNLPVHLITEHIGSKEPVPIFENNKQAIEYFGKEFVSEEFFTEEKRKFPRVPTALAGEFELQSDSGKPFFFDVVVTNLSEGGLYGCFLDKPTEELAFRLIDPFDLKLLKVCLNLNKNTVIHTEGKVLRSEKNLVENHGLALEFYNLKDKEKEEIRNFLKKDQGQ